jgi:hypothetical protein
LKLQGLRDLCANSGSLPKKIDQHYNDYKIEGKLEDEALQALRLDLREQATVEAALETSSARMENTLETIKQHLNAYKSADRSCKVEWVRVFPRTIAPMTEADLATVDSLKRLFAGILSRTRNVMDTSGSEVDIENVVRNKVFGTSEPCFKAGRRSRGFKALVLVDRSMSMIGERSRQAEHGVRILARALALPFIDFDVWGFQSFEEGDVVLSRVDPISCDFGANASGYTPLHIALNEAIKHLKPGQEFKQLILLSDGGPYFVDTAKKLVPERELRDALAKAHHCGIHTSALLIGSENETGEFKFDASPVQVAQMFGHASNWEYVRDSDISAYLVRTLRKSFLRYLRVT